MSDDPTAEDSGRASDGTLSTEGVDARLRGILDALPDLIFVVSKDYVIEAYRAPDPQKLLVPPSHFIGRPAREVLPPDVAQLLCTAVDETLATAESRRVEYSLDLPQGRRWFEAMSAVCDPDSVLFVIRDRTEQVLTEQRLRMADRMASLGTLAAGVAHEINNPLTYVYGNLEVVRDKVSQSQPLDAELADARVRRIVVAQLVIHVPEGRRLLDVGQNLHEPTMMKALRHVLDGALGVDRARREDALRHLVVADGETQLHEVVAS